MFLYDPVGDFVHRAHIVAKVVHILLHDGKLLQLAPEPSHRVGHGSHGLAHPAQKAWT